MENNGIMEAAKIAEQEKNAMKHRVRKAHDTIREIEKVLKKIRDREKRRDFSKNSPEVEKLSKSVEEKMEQLQNVESREQLGQIEDRIRILWAEMAVAGISLIDNELKAIEQLGMSTKNTANSDLHLIKEIINEKKAASSARRFEEKKKTFSDTRNEIGQALDKMKNAKDVLESALKDAREDVDGWMKYEKEAMNKSPKNNPLRDVNQNIVSLLAKIKTAINYGKAAEEEKEKAEKLLAKLEEETCDGEEPKKHRQSFSILLGNPLKELQKASLALVSDEKYKQEFENMMARMDQILSQSENDAEEKKQKELMSVCEDLLELSLWGVKSYLGKVEELLKKAALNNSEVQKLEKTARSVAEKATELSYEDIMKQQTQIKESLKSLRKLFKKAYNNMLSVNGAFTEYQERRKVIGNIMEKKKSGDRTFEGRIALVRDLLVSIDNLVGQGMFAKRFNEIARRARKSAESVLDDLRAEARNLDRERKYNEKVLKMVLEMDEKEIFGEQLYEQLNSSRMQEGPAHLPAETLKYVPLEEPLEQTEPQAEAQEVSEQRESGEEKSDLKQTEQTEPEAPIEDRKGEIEVREEEIEDKEEEGVQTPNTTEVCIVVNENQIDVTEELAEELASTMLNPPPATEPDVLQLLVFLQSFFWPVFPLVLFFAIQAAASCFPELEERQVLAMFSPAAVFFAAIMRHLMASMDRSRYLKHKMVIFNIAHVLLVKALVDASYISTLSIADRLHVACYIAVSINWTAALCRRLEQTRGESFHMQRIESKITLFCRALAFFSVTVGALFFLQSYSQQDPAELYVPMKYAALAALHLFMGEIGKLERSTRGAKLSVYGYGLLLLLAALLVCAFSLKFYMCVVKIAEEKRMSEDRGWS